MRIERYRNGMERTGDRNECFLYDSFWIRSVAVEQSVRVVVSLIDAQRSVADVYGEPSLSSSEDPTQSRFRGKVTFERDGL